jgi:serine/threonine protein kinase
MTAHLISSPNSCREKRCASGFRKGPLRLREALDFGAEIARGLGARHDAGVIHPDLKPENIFITKDGRVKILDFGLAKLVNKRPQIGLNLN